MAVSVDQIRKAQRAEGPANVLAIGTATPPHCVSQADYPDYYFRITNSEHMTELKEKFKRMCKSTFSSSSSSFVFDVINITYFNLWKYICKIMQVINP